MKNHSCISCYREIPDTTKFMICENCLKDIEFLNKSTCKKCGDLLNDKGECINDCKKYNYAFSENISLCYYTNTASRIIKNFKYGKHKYLAENIAQMLFEIEDKFKDIDYVLYVPVSKFRLRERGFNQSKELAKIIAEKFNVELLDALIKTKETIHQAGVNQKDRMKNLLGSFAVNEKFNDFIKSKNILIVDDVFTTGSTLNECSKVVKKLKPKTIKTITFAKTKFNLTQNNQKFEF